MFVILVYDVKENRVNKVKKICRQYLTWVQNSVFEGEITDANLQILKDKLAKIIKEDYDSVLIYKFRTKYYYERESLGIEKISHENLII